MPPPTHPDLVTVALKVPQAVLCLLSALAYHELTTQIPHAVHIALESGSDASVLYAGCYSDTGSARELTLESVRGKVALVVTPHLGEEVERNLALKASQALPDYQAFIALADPERAKEPALDELQQAASYTALKDAPIVAAAIKADVDY